MKKLIIGGCGFVGSVLTEKLIEKGYSVIVYDNLKYGYLKNIENLPIEFIKGDIENPKILNKYLPEIDIIYFLATVNIIDAEYNYSNCINTNILGLNNILKLIKNHKNIKRFVYTSTSSIYGNNFDIHENSNTNFLNIYSTTKYSGECLCKLYSNIENLPITIIRYTNIYGKNQRPESKFCGVVGRFIHQSVNNYDIKINGDGTQYRDFMYVEDAVYLTIQLSLMKETINDSINLSTNNIYTILEISEIIKELANSKSKIIHIQERNIDNIKYRKINNNKLLSIINYNFTDIKYGIKTTIEWYKKNYLHEI